MASVISFNPDNTLGAYQIGVLISYVLLGVTTTQVYIYYNRFPEDSFKVKALDSFCEVVHAICLGHTLYVVTISDYADLGPERVFGAVPRSFPAAILVSGIIGGSVQGFFAFRVYKLSQKLFVPIICWVMSALRAVMAALISITLLQETSLAKYEVQWKWAMTTLWSVSTVNDLTITMALVTILAGKRNTFKKTAALVDKLILYTIETGMLTSMSSIAALACVCFISPNAIEVACLIWFLSFLNSRATLRTMEQVTLPLSFIHNTGSGSPSNTAGMSKESRISAVRERFCRHCGNNTADSEDV
ncbi:hypothetical protein K438DRAFT_1827871 [Mycena galopus ATCC 62051]|nr:hypothetical protein K438DRAFT_1827871 [Mycena galopus ATCC 62051]